MLPHRNHRSTDSRRHSDSLPLQFRLLLLLLFDLRRGRVYVNETNLKVPSGEVLASNIHSHEFQLVGDVEALSLVEETHNLNQYLRAKF